MAEFRIERFLSTGIFESLPFESGIEILHRFDLAGKRDILSEWEHNKNVTEKMLSHWWCRQNASSAHVENFMVKVEAKVDIRVYFYSLLLFGGVSIFNPAIETVTLKIAICYALETIDNYKHLSKIRRRVVFDSSGYQLETNLKEALASFDSPTKRIDIRQYLVDQVSQQNCIFDCFDCRYFKYKIAIGGVCLTSILKNSLETPKVVDIFLLFATKRKLRALVAEFSILFGTKLSIVRNKVKILCRNEQTILSFVLSIFDSINHLLLAFDIDVEAIAFDGKKTLATKLSLLSIEENKIYCSLDRARQNYEKRILKLSNNFGFDVVVASPLLIDPEFQDHSISRGCSILFSNCLTTESVETEHWEEVSLAEKTIKTLELNYRNQIENNSPFHRRMSKDPRQWYSC